VAERALPDLKSRITIDTTPLKEAETKAKSFNASFVSAMGGSTKSAENFEKGLRAAHGAIGESTGAVEGLVGKLNILSGLGGLGGAGIAAAGLTAAMGVGLEVAKSSIEMYVSLGEKVLNFQRVTGASAEQSSRMVAVMGELGVDGETAAAAMFKLNQRMQGLDGQATKTGKSLQELGIKTNVDLTKTLENVADAYVNAGSAAERDSITFAAFGRAGAAMIPVLEQGSAGLERLAAQTNLVFTQEQLEQVHQYNISTKQLSQSLEVLQMDMGGKLVPSVETAVRGFSELADITHFLIDGQAHNVAEANALAIAQQHAGEQAIVTKDRLEELTASIKDQTKAQDDLVAATFGSIDADLAKQRADLSVSDALQKLSDDTRTNSWDTRLMTSDQLSAKDALVNAAKATQKLAEEHAKLGGATLSARDSQAVLRQALQDEEAQLSADSPLRRDLDAYISLLRDVPTDITTHFSIVGMEGANAPGFRQHGGPVLAGQAYDVGETGRERLYMYPGGGGYVVPNGGSGEGPSMGHTERLLTIQNEMFAQLLAAVSRQPTPAFSTGAYGPY
jgi:hypothetical protein